MSRHLQGPLLRFIVALLFGTGLFVVCLAPTAYAAGGATEGPRTHRQATQPQWGIYSGSYYQCCYPGKGEDVLLIHGVDGNGYGDDGNDPSGNCQVNFGPL